MNDINKLDQIFNIGDEVFIPKELEPYEALQTGAEAYVDQIYENHIIFRLQKSGVKRSYRKNECDKIRITGYADIIPGVTNLDEYRKKLRGNSGKK